MDVSRRGVLVEVLVEMLVEIVFGKEGREVGEGRGGKRGIGEGEGNLLLGILDRNWRGLHQDEKKRGKEREGEGLWNEERGTAM